MPQRRRRKNGLNGLSSVRRLFKKLPKEFGAEVADVLNAYGGFIEASAKGDVPVNLGTLRKSISRRKARPNRLSTEIGVRTKRQRQKAFYAIWVFRGRRAYFRGRATVQRTAANPVMQRALARFAPRAVNDISAAVRLALKRAARAGYLRE